MNYFLKISKINLSSGNEILNKKWTCAEMISETMETCSLAFNKLLISISGNYKKNEKSESQVHLPLVFIYPYLNMR